jgi:hypothetical protein
MKHCPLHQTSIYVFTLYHGLQFVIQGCGRRFVVLLPSLGSQLQWPRYHTPNGLGNSTLLSPHEGSSLMFYRTIGTPLDAMLARRCSWERPRKSLITV